MLNPIVNKGEINVPDDMKTKALGSYFISPLLITKFVIYKNIHGVGELILLCDSKKKKHFSNELKKNKVIFVHTFVRSKACRIRTSKQIRETQ